MENTPETSLGVSDIPMVQVGNHDIPVLAFLKIVELYQFGATSQEIIEQVLEHTSSSTLLVVTDVVHGVIANEECMGNYSNQLQQTVAPDQGHTSDAGCRIRAPTLSAQHHISSLPQISDKRARLRPLSVGGLRYASAVDLDEVPRERNVRKIHEIASRSPLQHLEAVATIAHSVNRANRKRSAAAEDVQRFQSSRRNASNEISRAGEQHPTLHELDLQTLAAQKKLDAATESLQVTRARLKYLERSHSIAASRK